MTDFGSDLSCTTDLTPTMRETSGIPMMREVAQRRLSTQNQSLLSAPSERTTDLRLYVSSTQERDSRFIGIIRADIVAALTADERFFSVAATIEWDPDASFFEAHLDINSSAGPFRQTLKINQVKVETLS